MAAFSCVQLLIELIQGLGVLLPADGVQRLLLDPGGKGAHDTGDGHHGQHGHRVARMLREKAE